MSQPAPQNQPSPATREAYGQRLMELGEMHPEIVVLDADLSGSTKTSVFAKKFPNRFFNVGVAEQDLIGTAAGLAHSGLTVFASSFAMFATGRAWEIVRNSVAYPHLNVKICASHAGITVGEDGASHQIIEDLAIMRVIPGIKVFCPADAHQTRAMLDVMVTDKGPTYLRLSRAASDVVFDSSYKFSIGKGDVIKSGSDVCLFVTGFPTAATVAAAVLLNAKGISASVVNLGSIKPIDEELIVKMARAHKHLFSVEEHTVMAGFGSAIAEVLVRHEPKKLTFLGLQDEFGQSGPSKQLLKHYRLDAEGIADSVLTSLG